MYSLHRTDEALNETMSLLNTSTEIKQLFYVRKSYSFQIIYHIQFNYMDSNKLELPSKE